MIINCEYDVMCLLKVKTKTKLKQKYNYWMLQRKEN